MIAQDLRIAWRRSYYKYIYIYVYIFILFQAIILGNLAVRSVDVVNTQIRNTHGTWFGLTKGSCSMERRKISKLQCNECYKTPPMLLAVLQRSICSMSLRRSTPGWIVCVCFKHLWNIMFRNKWWVGIKNQYIQTELGFYSSFHGIGDSNDAEAILGCSVEKKLMTPWKFHLSKMCK